MRALVRLALVVLPLLAFAGVLELLGWWLAPAAGTGGAAARTRTFNELFYDYDRDLVVRLKPDLEGDFRTIRPDLQASVTTNSAGFRGPEWEEPRADALRIVALGDSVTFGLGVADGETWPAVLERRLRQRSGRPVQVRNLAVPGYSTDQGRILFERHGSGGPFAPQLVIFAFGFNDGFLRPHDDEVTRRGERFRHEHWAGRLRAWLGEHSWFLRWLLAPGPLEAATPRVPQDRLRENLESVVVAAEERGVELLLADASLPHCYVRDALTEVARRHGVACLSFRDAFRHAVGGPPEGRWREGGRLRVLVETGGMAVPAAPDGQAALEVLFLPTAAARPRARLVPLRDDGGLGDEHAGDGRWSCLLDVTPGARPELAFRVPALAPTVPAMQSPGALLNGSHLLQPGPTARSPERTAELAVRADRINQPPWPELVLLPDPIHASPAGCVVIASALEERIAASAAWKEFAR